MVCFLSFLFLLISIAPVSAEREPIFTVPDGTKVIPANAYANSKEIQENILLLLPEGVEEIGSGAFRNHGFHFVKLLERRDGPFRSDPFYLCAMGAIWYNKRYERRWSGCKEKSLLLKTERRSSMFKSLIKKNPVLGGALCLICYAAIVAGIFYVISLIRNQPFDSRNWIWVAAAAIGGTIADVISAQKDNK